MNSFDKVVNIIKKYVYNEYHGSFEIKIKPGENVVKSKK
jgi:hypothetical protein